MARTTLSLERQLFFLKLPSCCFTGSSASIRHRHELFADKNTRNWHVPTQFPLNITSVCLSQVALSCFLFLVKKWEHLLHIKRNNTHTCIHIFHFSCEYLHFAEVAHARTHSKYRNIAKQKERGKESPFVYLWITNNYISGQGKWIPVASARFLQQPSQVSVSNGTPSWPPRTGGPLSFFVGSFPAHLLEKQLPWEFS